MNVRIFFHEMEHSVAIEKKAEELMQKIYTFLENEREPIYIHLTIQAGRPHAHHEVELRIKSPNYELMTKKEGPELYLLLNEVVDLMYAKLHERKQEMIKEARKKDSYKGA